MRRCVSYRKNVCVFERRVLASLLSSLFFLYSQFPNLYSRSPSRISICSPRAKEVRWGFAPSRNQAARYTRYREWQTPLRTYKSELLHDGESRILLIRRTWGRPSTCWRPRTSWTTSAARKIRTMSRSRTFSRIRTIAYHSKIHNTSFFRACLARFQTCPRRERRNISKRKKK